MINTLGETGQQEVSTFSEEAKRRHIKAFWERLCELLDAANPNDAAEKLNKIYPVAKSGVYKWSNGESWPSSEYLVALRDSTKVSIDWLWSGEGEKYIFTSGNLTEQKRAESVQAWAKLQHFVGALAQQSSAAPEEIIEQLLTIAKDQLATVPTLADFEVVPLPTGTEYEFPLGELLPLGTVRKLPSTITLMVDANLLRGCAPADCLALRIATDAFEDDGITRGQTLLCLPSTTVQDGDLVIARAGDRVFIRRYYATKANVQLAHRLHRDGPRFYAHREIEVLFVVVDARGI